MRSVCDVHLRCLIIYSAIMKESLWNLKKICRLSPAFSFITKGAERRRRRRRRTDLSGYIKKSKTLFTTSELFTIHYFCITGNKHENLYLFITLYLLISNTFNLLLQTFRNIIPFIKTCTRGFTYFMHSVFFAGYLFIY